MKQIEQTLTSMEVAEMVEKTHANLLKDIRTYLEQLGEVKIHSTDFFTESEYTTSQNKKAPCYKVTKKGCEFIAHKLTGVKGTAFTARYIEKFHDMEDVIKEHIPKGDELIALAVIEAQKQLAERDKQIETMKPKAMFADMVTASNNDILVRDLAKLICQNGYGIGEKRLHTWLRENGYTYRAPDSSIRPKQRYVEMGLFRLDERPVTQKTFNDFGDVTGEVQIRVNFTTRVTGKGQAYFIDKFRKIMEDKQNEAT